VAYRVIAQLLGIRHANANAGTTVYDPTCGSGSLLLKVADEAAHGSKMRVTLYGQEKDNATAGLARMNSQARLLGHFVEGQAVRESKSQISRASDGRAVPSETTRSGITLQTSNRSSWISGREGGGEGGTDGSTQ
jgi:23S rRNA G2445 N2-methylase RlmL